MLTQAVIDNFVDLAGDDRMWEGVKGSHRPGSDVRRQLRDDLIERQGNTCPVCGWTLRFPQFNHVVSRGPAVKGFLPLNVFAGCATCNLDCALTYGEVDEDNNVIDGGVIPIERFARPELIPSEWTPFPVLRERRKASKR
jgi:hypothetical protein